jgi:hypothetical protein
VLLGKGIRLTGEDLQHAHSAMMSTQRHDGDGLHAHQATDFRINQRVSGGVVATHDRPGAQAFPRDSGIHVEGDAQLWRGFTAAADANHRSAARHGNSRSTGSSQGVGRDRDRAQDSFCFLRARGDDASQLGHNNLSSVRVLDYLVGNQGSRP